jgi:hypothetical protein
MSRRNRNREVTTSAPVLVSDVPVVSAEPVAAPEAPVAAPEVAPVAAAPVAAAPVAPTLKYPRVGGKCWQVWNACDEMAKSQPIVTVKDARQKAILEGWNLSNASQEFYRWKKFHGLPK